MRNRAKCKLCQGIIESFHSEDYVTCKCDEISVSGGVAMYCAARHWENFVRVDDEGNEIIPKMFDDVTPLDINNKPTKKDLLDMLQGLIASIESLPSHAMTQPVTHYDLVSALILLQSILRAD